jgi:putative oxidoreductase
LKADNRLQVALLLLRAGVFIVMLVWTLDKLLRPEHMASVFERYYGIGGLGSVAAWVIGGAELLLILAFLGGMWKRWTYGAVLLLHGVSTLASFGKYLAPFDASNLLFFAAWPMLAACTALYLLRDADTLWTMPRTPRIR